MAENQLKIQLSKMSIPWYDLVT